MSGGSGPPTDQEAAQLDDPTRQLLVRWRQSTSVAIQGITRLEGELQEARAEIQLLRKQRDEAQSRNSYLEQLLASSPAAHNFTISPRKKRLQDELEQFRRAVSPEQRFRFNAGDIEGGKELSSFDLIKSLIQEQEGHLPPSILRIMTDQATRVATGIEDVGIEAELEAEEQERMEEQTETAQQRARNGIGPAVDSTQNEQVDQGEAGAHLERVEEENDDDDDLMSEQSESYDIYSGQSTARV